MDSIFIEVSISVLSGAIGAFISYEFIEKRRRRIIETYWKVEEEYRSTVQHEARTNIEKVENDLETQDVQSRDELIKYYNSKYHFGEQGENKATAKKIRYRIRFLNKIGLLLKKGMIDKDLVFDLIGTGLEIDQKTMEIVLAAHREGDKKPDMYRNFEYLVKEYQKWKQKNRK